MNVCTFLSLHPYFTGAPPHWQTVPGFRRRSNQNLPNFAVAHLLRYISRCAACFVFEVSTCACRQQRRHDIGMAADGCKVECC